MRQMILLLLALMLAACAPAAEPDVVVEAEPETAVNTPREETVDPTAPPEPTAALPPTTTPIPTNEPVVEEADGVEAVEVEEVEEETAVAEQPATLNVITERTPEGAFVLGDPNAPLTFIEYSDFL